MASKIATCCYCGTRAALVMTEAGRHELSCSACGAPLHEMKALPARKVASAPEISTPGAGMARPHPAKARTKRGKSRKKMRKFSPIRMLSKAVEEIWDEVEDIFD